MQKIEIITLHYIKNYGSVLQTYATQKKFELMGYECEVIDYIRPNAEEKEELKSGLGRKNFGSNKLIKYLMTFWINISIYLSIILLMKN